MRTIEMPKTQTGRVAAANRRRPLGVRWQCSLTACLALALCATAAPARLIACDGAREEQISAALAQIERSVDPCGESAEVHEVLAVFKSCSHTVYQICTDLELSRNVFDRPFRDAGDIQPGVITWNPLLRSELEPACAGDASKPVTRDPTASLLHELVHAAHDCEGIKPGIHEEIEAVRVENIYRRAAGLCQRTAYGEDLLPLRWQKQCTPEHCSCASPDASGGGTRAQLTAPSPAGRAAADVSWGDGVATANDTAQ